MKKTLIASAVAATLSTSAFAMDPASELAAKLDSMPTIYGNIQLAMAWENLEGSYAGGTSKDSSYEFADNGSTIGFKHSHEIAPGVTGYLKAEFEFDGDRAKGAGKGLVDGDQAFIGVKGNFGDIKAGSYDTIFEDASDDKVADLFEALGTYSHSPTDEGDTITYYTPSMGGFSAALAVQINGEKDGGKNPNPRNPVMAVVSYEVDAFELNLAVDSADNTNSKSAYAATGVFNTGNMAFGLGYSAQDEQSKIISLSGTFTMGANQFIALYQNVDYDKEATVTFGGDLNGDGIDDTGGALGVRDSAQSLSLQALHNLSDNMYVYVEGRWLEDTAKDKAAGGVDVENLTGIMGATYVF